jgi:hypothetical protein
LGFQIFGALSRKRLFPAGNDMTAGANRIAGLDRDFYGIGWQD